MLYKQIILRMYSKYPGTHVNRFIPRELGRLLGGGDISTRRQRMILYFISKQFTCDSIWDHKRFKAVLLELL